MSDEQDFVILMRQNRERVYRLVFHLLGDAEEAKDATQETFVRAWKKFDTMRWETSQAWLLKIAVNLCLDWLRRRKFRGDFPEEEETQDNPDCELCKRELALTRSIPRLVNSLTAPSVPADIIPNALNRLHELPATHGGWLRSLRWPLAAATSILLLTFLFSIGYQRINREPAVEIPREISAAEVALAAEEIRFALGIVSIATQDVQLTALTEGLKALDVVKNMSENTVQTISESQFEVFKKLQRNLPVLIQLQYKEVRQL